MSKIKFEMPHVFVIVITMVIIAGALTWIIPAGEFDRKVNEVTGQLAVIPGTFHFIEQRGVNPFMIPLYLVNGLIGSANIAAAMLIAGGAFSIIIKTGMIQALTAFFAKKYANREFLVIPVFMTLFSTAGMIVSGNSIIGFAPLSVLIARSLGYDAIVGVAMVCLAVGIGFSTGTLNPNTTAIAQSIGGLPIFSGIEYRLLSWAVFLVVTTIYVLSYARKIKKNPKLSAMYDIEMDVKNATTKESSNYIEEHSVQKRHYLVAIIFILGFASVMYGSVRFKFGLPQIASVYLVMGVLTGLSMGYSFNQIAEAFLNGAKGTLFGLFLVGFSRAISIVLSEGKILDTTIYYLAEVLGMLPSYLQATAMYFMQVTINALIVSGSGQASATMPIILPVGDLIGMTRQTVILAFNFGDGFSNYILPTSAALMGFLGMAGVPYDKWMKFMGKLFLIWSAVAIILITIADIINYGPF